MPRHALARLGVAVLAFAAVATGLVAGFGALALAVDWRLPEPVGVGQPSLLVDRHGTPVHRFAAEVERTPIPLSEIAEPLEQAVVAAEDHRFYEHRGVDPFSVVRAVVRNVTASHLREGGSTLTQQYVKNAFTGADRTFTRKAREAILALQLEKEQGKDAILEAYLNQAYFGDGAYGAEAAARSYFDVGASELTLAQSATLAGLLTAPSDRSPRHHPEEARARRDRVLDRMARLGMVTDAEADRARAEPLAVAERDDRPSVAPYYVEQVRQHLLRDPDIGPERLYYRGLRITAALDLEQHVAVRRTLAEQLPADERLDAGLAVVDPATGDVRASYSGRDFEASQVDLALGRSWRDADPSGRMSGSTFKAFGLVAALEDEWTLESTYPAPSRVTIGDWTVIGSGGCPTPCTLLAATVRSANTVFAQLARDVGGARLTEAARRLGSRHDFDDPGDLTHVLGTGDVTPLDLASAFGALANDGVACPARLVTDVRTPDSAPIEPPDPRQPTEAERDRWTAHLAELGYEPDQLDGDGELGRCVRAVPPSVARAAVHALEQVVARGTGTRAQLDRHPVAGKTGTADDSKAIWFSGVTPHLAMAVSFGGRGAQVELAGLPGCRGGPCFGGELTAELWREVAERLRAGLEPGAFGERLPDERTEPHDRRKLRAPQAPPAEREDDGAEDDGHGEEDEPPWLPILPGRAP